MNNNQNNTNGRGLPGEDVPLTPEERARLEELLHLSCPSPRRSIKAGVMAEIAAARAKEAKRKKFRTHFVKYGSAAACFFLMVGAILGILPLLDRTSNDATEEMAYNADLASYMDEEIPSETPTKAKKSDTYVVKRPAGMYGRAPSRARAAVAAPEPEPATAMENESGRMNSATEVIAGTTDAPAEACVEEEAVPEAASLTEADSYADASDASAETTAPEAPKIMASMIYSSAPAPGKKESKVCPIHGDILHTFSNQLTEYVGEEAFRPWYYSEEAADTCGSPTVMTFVAHFAIPREVFLPLAEASEVPYDADAVYAPAED